MENPGLCWIVLPEPPLDQAQDLTQQARFAAHQEPALPFLTLQGNGSLKVGGNHKQEWILAVFDAQRHGLKPTADAGVALDTRRSVDQFRGQQCAGLKAFEKRERFRCPDPSLITLEQFGCVESWQGRGKPQTSPAGLIDEQSSLKNLECSPPEATSMGVIRLSCRDPFGHQVVDRLQRRNGVSQRTKTLRERRATERQRPSAMKLTIIALRP